MPPPPSNVPAPPRLFARPPVTTRQSSVVAVPERSVTARPLLSALMTVAHGVQGWICHQMR